MAKNTGSSKFRKVDVDQYDEDRYEDDIIDAVEEGPNEIEVNNLLQRYLGSIGHLTRIRWYYLPQRATLKRYNGFRATEDLGKYGVMALRTALQK